VLDTCTWGRDNKTAKTPVPARRNAKETTRTNGRMLRLAGRKS
jgi:hypothetical protein